MESCWDKYNKGGNSVSYSKCCNSARDESCTVGRLFLAAEKDQTEYDKKCNLGNRTIPNIVNQHLQNLEQHGPSPGTEGWMNWTTSATDYNNWERCPGHGFTNTTGNYTCNTEDSLK